MTTASPNVFAVRINGDPREIPPNMNVTALLDWLEIAPDKVAIELDKAIVRKRDWPITEVLEGAQIEIVQFVGGG